MRQAVAADAQSIVTVDRLKKFNEIQGTTAGNVIDEIAAAQAAAGEFPEADVEPGQGEEGCAQGAEDALEGDLREEERDEVLSQQM